MTIGYLLVLFVGNCLNQLDGYCNQQKNVFLFYYTTFFTSQLFKLYILISLSQSTTKTTTNLHYL